MQKIDDNNNDDLSLETIDDKLMYNDYYINQGIDYIKRNEKLNDPLMNLVFEKEAENITTPLNDWKKRGFDNNNNYYLNV